MHPYPPVDVTVMATVNQSYELAAGGTLTVVFDTGARPLSEDEAALLVRLVAAVARGDAVKAGE